MGSRRAPRLPTSTDCPIVRREPPWVTLRGCSMSKRNVWWPSLHRSGCALTTEGPVGPAFLRCAFCLPSIDQSISRIGFVCPRHTARSATPGGTPPGSRSPTALPPRRVHAFWATPLVLGVLVLRVVLLVFAITSPKSASPSGLGAPGQVSRFVDSISLSPRRTRSSSGVSRSVGAVPVRNAPGWRRPRPRKWLHMWDWSPAEMTTTGRRARSIDRFGRSPGLGSG